MATSNTTSAGFDASGLLDQAVSQFRGLNTSEPGQWPWMPKAAVFLVVAAAVVAVGWFALVSSALEELEAERDREPALKAQFESKLAQAVNLCRVKLTQHQQQVNVRRCPQPAFSGRSVDQRRHQVCPECCLGGIDKGDDRLFDHCR